MSRYDSSLRFDVQTKAGTISVLVNVAAAGNQDGAVAVHQQVMEHVRAHGLPVVASEETPPEVSFAEQGEDCL